MNSLERTITQLISKHPFFVGLNSRHCESLAAFAKPMRFESTQHIFYEQAEADHFYLIDTGKVAVEMFVPGKAVITLETLGAGDALGWSWFFPPYRWHFSARAMAPTETVALDAMKLRKWAGEDKDFGYQLATRIANVVFQRLQTTRRRLSDFYGVPA